MLRRPLPDPNPGHPLMEVVHPRLTARQGAIISAYTGVLAGDVADALKYAQSLLGRPVWTHEMGSPDFQEQLKELAKKDFLAICAD